MWTILAFVCLPAHRIVALDDPGTNPAVPRLVVHRSAIRACALTADGHNSMLFTTSEHLSAPMDLDWRDMATYCTRGGGPARSCLESPTHLLVGTPQLCSLLHRGAHFQRAQVEREKRGQRSNREDQKAQEVVGGYPQIGERRPRLHRGPIAEKRSAEIRETAREIRPTVRRSAKIGPEGRERESLSRYASPAARTAQPKDTAVNIDTRRLRPSDWRKSGTAQSG